jgi:hypothetical protein
VSSRHFTRACRAAAVALAVAARAVGAQAGPEPPGAMGDPYAEAAGLRPLRFQTLPRGTREIRVWLGGGMGWPQSLYRLVARGGRSTGEYIRYWDLVDDDGAPDSTTFAALIRYYERGRCEPVHRGRSAEACRARFQTEPDWRAVWRTADSLGVWTLPDAPPPSGNTITLDGWGITVELRDGAAYRAWRYDNPDARHSPEAARASAFASALRSIDTLMRRSAAERVYVGRVDVRADTLEFSPCAGGGPWLLNTYDTRLVVPRGGSAPSPPSRRAVVRGTLVPEWVARDWWDVPRRFQRTLQIDSVLALSSWAPGGCTRSDRRTPEK